MTEAADAATPPPVDTDAPKESEKLGRVEKQKDEITFLARATLRREAKRQLTNSDGTKKEPQTLEEQALNVYGTLSELKNGDGFNFGDEGNPVTLPRIEGQDQFGNSVQYDSNKASLREIVSTRDDGAFVCTLRDESGRRVTRTHTDTETGEERDVDVQIVLPREAVLDAQFLSERALYENAVDADQKKLLESHASTLPQTAEDFKPTDETDKVIESAAVNLHVLTAKDILNSPFYKQLPEEKRAQLKEKLKDSTILEPRDLREVTTLMGWDQLGVRGEHKRITAELSELKDKTDEYSKLRREDLEAQLAMLGKTYEALKPDENGRSQVDDVLEQLQSGEMDEEIAKATKDALMTGDTEYIFKALKLPDNVDDKTKQRLLQSAKVAGLSGLVLLGLLIAVAGTTVKVVGSGMAADSRR